MQPEILEGIKKARAILADHYVPWITDDGKGGHCAAGALSVAFDKEIYGKVPYPAQTVITETARALHPELAGMVARRPSDSSFVGHDSFDEWPFVYVNNHLGKEAILRVFDVAILEAELARQAEKPENAIEEPAYAHANR